MKENKWNERFIDLAKHISMWSKDPSTKVGAVIVDDKKRIVGMGYNGFPRGVDDSIKSYMDKELKHKMVVHAEANAILNAVKQVEGCTIYVWPLFSCQECAKLIIQAGITKVVAPAARIEEYGVAKDMYEQAGVEMEIV